MRLIIFGLFIFWSVMACTIIIGSNTTHTNDADKTGIVINPEEEL